MSAEEEVSIESEDAEDEVKVSRKPDRESVGSPPKEHIHQIKTIIMIIIAKRIIIIIMTVRRKEQ